MKKRQEKRTFDSKKYILSALIVSLIFILGLTIGLVVENKRVDYLMNFYEVEKDDFESLQIQYTLLTSNLYENNTCPGLKYTFNEYLKKLDEKGNELEAYRLSSSSFNKYRFNLLLRRYLIEEVRSWILAKNIKKSCKDEHIVTILNFHIKDCPKCDDTGLLLSYFKKKFKDNLLIFSFDADFTQEPLVQVLKKIYNITTYPTLVIDDKKYEDFMNKQKIQGILCSYYNQSNDTSLSKECNS